MESITIFKQDVNDQCSPLLISIPRYTFSELVSTQALLLIMFFNPKSDFYVPPKAWTCSTVIESHFKLLGVMSNAQQIYSAVTLLLTYVDEVNSRPNQEYNHRKAPLFMVGEEYVHSQVYLALKFYHEWRVACIYDEHAKQGKDFGSATAWQTDDWIKKIENWPTYWPQIQPIHSSPLPCNTPEYK